MESRKQDIEYFAEVKVNFKDIIGHWGEITLCKEIEILYQPVEEQSDFEVSLRYFSDTQTSSAAVPSGEHTTGQVVIDNISYKAMWLKPSYFYSVNQGEKFRLRLQAYNPKTYKHYYYDLGINFCRPEKNNEITAQKANFNFDFKEYNGGDNTNFYGSKPGIVVTKWPDLAIDGPYPDFQSIKIQLKDSTNTIYFTGTRTYTEQNEQINWGDWEISKDVPSKYSSAATLSVYLVDKVGTSVLVGSRYYQSGRSSIGFKSGVITFNMIPYNPHPIKKNSLIIIHPIGNSPASPGKIEYNYFFNSINIIPETKENNGDIHNATYPRNKLNSIFPEDWINGSGQIPIIVTAKNAFGDTVSISTALQYDYYLKPEWDSGAGQIEIQHDFDGGDEVTILGGILKEYAINDLTTHQKDLRCFCTGESAILTLPEIADPNGGNIYYKIQHAIVEYTDGIPEKEGLVYKDLVTSHIGMEYNYKVSSLDAKDYCCYFRVCATNRISNAEYTTFKYSPLIFLCRTQTPFFNINSVSTISNESNTLTILFDKRNLDFGQSGIFANYERNLNQFGISNLPSAKLVLTIDYDSNFKSGNKITAYISTFDSIKNSAWQFEISINNWPENWKNQKIYIKLELEIDYGINSKIISQPYIYFTIVNGIPTVAHRKNHVGINTAGFTLNDVLRIAPVDGRTLITFEFLEGDSATLDLTNKAFFISSLKNLLDS